CADVHGRLGGRQRRPIGESDLSGGVAAAVAACALESRGEPMADRHWWTHRLWAAHQTGPGHLCATGDPRHRATIGASASRESFARKYWRAGDVAVARPPGHHLRLDRSAGDDAPRA